MSIFRDTEEQNGSKPFKNIYICRGLMRMERYLSIRTIYDLRSPRHYYMFKYKSIMVLD